MARASEQYLTVTLLTLYAATLLVSLNLTPLWLDEIQQFANSHHTTLGYFMLWVKLEVGASPLPYLAQRGVVDALGFSVFSARLPAAICSVLCGVVFAMLSRYFLTRGRVLALGMFLLLPLQFRYGVEGRVYSQGLLFALLSIWQLLRMWERPTVAQGALYFLTAAAGMYSQPLVCFPLLAEAIYARTSPDRKLRWAVWIAVGAAFVGYVPWYIAKLHIQAHMPLSVYFFSLRQITPATLLHELTGGGYPSAIALLVLACWPGKLRSDKLAPEIDKLKLIPHCSSSIGEPSRTSFSLSIRHLLLWVIALSMIGPIVVDAMVHYYFAARQNLFALPALIVLAAQGWERLQEQGSFARAAALVLPAVFLLGGAYTDYRLATIPRDDLARTADVLVERLPRDGCILAAPREQIGFYSFLRPELEGRMCGDGLAPAFVVVSSSYTTPAARKATLDAIPSQYAAAAPVKIGQSELIQYRLK